MGETRSSNPVVAGWLVAIIGLIIAGAFGYLLMWIGSNRIEAAKKLERPYRVALAYIAQNGLTAVEKAQASIGTNDWGQAQRALDETGQAVTAMERAASDDNKRQIQDLRAALGDAQGAVSKQDKSAPDRIAEVRSRLEAFTQEAK